MTTAIGAYTVTLRYPGSGEAYLARSADGRNCVLRIFAVAPDDARVERVRSETLACAALAHPAVGLINDVFGHDGKTAVVCPEPLEGPTLAEVVTKLRQIGERLPEAGVWHLGHQMAAALSLAHASEVDGDFLPVCHGHLSPKEIAISWDGGVRMDGLGLGPLAGEAGLELTPRYTAPEQRSGGRITPRGDVYALATIIHELLTGNEPRELMAVEEMTSVPESIREALRRALEQQVGKRRITSAELEQCFKEVLGDGGKTALVETVALLKKGSTLLGHGSSGMTAGGRADKAGAEGVKLPPLRSKQATLVGGAPEARKKMDSGAPIDWTAAAASASQPGAPEREEIADELSWGVGEDPTGHVMRSQPPAPLAEFDGEDEDLTTISSRPAHLKVGSRPTVAKGEPSEDDLTTIAARPAEILALARNEEEERTNVSKRSALEAAEPKHVELEPAAKRGSRRPLPRSPGPLPGGPGPLPGGPGPLPGGPGPLPGGPGPLPEGEPKLEAVKEAPPPKAEVPKVEAPKPEPPKPEPPTKEVPPARTSTPDAARSSDPGRSSRPSVPEARKPQSSRPLVSRGKAKDDAPEVSVDAPEGMDLPKEKAFAAVERTVPLDEVGEELSPTTKRSEPPPPPKEEPKPAPIEEEPPPPPPRRIEPARVEPAKVEPAKVEPAKVEPSKIEAPPVAAAAQPARSSASPWGGDTADAAPAKEGPKPISFLTTAIITVLTALAVMVLGILLVRRTNEISQPPTLGSKPQPPALSVSVRPSAVSSTEPDASASSAPSDSAAPSASASTSASSEPGDVAPPETAVDPMQLPPTLGYLTVVYKADAGAEVLVQGKLIGKVNEALQVPCGRPAFMRLRGADAKWITNGQTVTVGCRAHTRVEILP
jgi:hypothetical protein